MKYLVRSAVIALSLSALPAAATTLSFEDSFGPAVTEFASPGGLNLNGTDANANALSLSRFDSALGTLTNVELSFEVSYTADGSITNSAAQSQTANAQQSLTVFLDSDVFASQLVVEASDQTGFINFATGDTGTAISLSGQASQTVTGLDFSSFIGGAGDTFEIDFGTLIGTSFQGGGGNLAFVVDTLGTVSANVTYTFDEVVDAPAPVPLPASGLLLIAGLAGVRALRRKKS